MGKEVDKRKLAEHLQLCAEIAGGKADMKVAAVLRNLKTELEAGLFDKDL
ncbi:MULTISPECIES: hypothetical protein [unclassified Paenibacillus]|nr:MULTISPECIES: hypothetical protein [unclassified Paenibacillus]MBU5445178.1 hypothetical protein [Paenibacillus sp. MSJ-34]CAH0122432.1 hypothetical protein PAE9249_04982 [Paenibacillus sp. CECT 9249]